MKLALGTVQFGLNYGIANTDGKPSFNQVSQIIKLAERENIKLLDTASAYGESEQVLGKLKAHEKCSIVSKIPPLAKQHFSIEQLIQQSLSRLNVENLYAMMFHHADDLLGSSGKGFYQEALLQKEKGVFEKLGVSVYHPSQLIKIFQTFKIDIIQCPFNCLDQRFASPVIQRIVKENQPEVHVRSLFLQGLLLMSLESLGSYFTPYLDVIKTFHDTCKYLNCQPLTLALSIIHKHQFIDYAVIGCCSKEQLEQILEHYYLAKNLDFANNFSFTQLASHENALINPSKWPIKE